MFVALQGNTPTVVLQKPAHLTTWHQGVHVVRPYDVLTILSVLCRLPVCGESGETKLHLERRGHAVQQYWPWTWRKRRILGGCLSNKDNLLLSYALFCSANKTSVTSPGSWLYSQCILNSRLLSQ